MISRTAYISDIHANITALQAVLKDIQDQECERIYNLGDTINGMNPSACIAQIKENENITSIRGNAEQYVLTPDLGNFPHRDEPEYAAMIGLIHWWQSHMSKDDFAFVRGLPNFLYVDDVCMVHESPVDRIAIQEADLGDLDEKYREISFHLLGIPEATSEDALEPVLKFMDEKSVSILFVGHTHEPYIRQLNGKHICNPGSVGLPLDGDPDPSWILCEEVDGEKTFGVRRVPYDIELAIQMMKELGFQKSQGLRRRDAYIKMLQTGIHWRFHI
jgi:predicted phosphodiesterase